MKHLLDFAAKPDDESLHVAARLTKASLVKLLLDHGASVNSPGFILAITGPHSANYAAVAIHLKIQRS